ncbi:MAG TPA: sulfatase [Vicinamibacteria bacterium]
MRIGRRDLLLAGPALALGLARCRGRVERPNVVLLTLDTTRRDRLGVYGYSRKTSPNLDALAGRSVVFDRAVAASSWTLPSHASIFTGKFPSSHGADYDPEGPLRLTQAIEGPEEWAEYRASGLSPSEKTLAILLRDQGYQTAAVVGGPWMKRIFGLDLGFETYDEEGILDVNGRLASEVTTAALEFLARVASPFFLFLNYFDPHGPYEAPAPFGGSFGQEPSDRYDEEILYMDHHIGRLLDGMKRNGIFEDSLILVTADHGELLGEHEKMGHGASLYEEEIHVPFFVKYPGEEVRPGRSAEPIHHVDVLPLVLERASVSTSRRKRHPLLSEVRPLDVMSPDGWWRALYLGRQKVLWNSHGNHALYDLEEDPGERKDLSRDEPERLKEALSVLEKVFASLPPRGEPGPPATLDEETQKALRSLGYVP